MNSLHIILIGAILNALTIAIISVMFKYSRGNDDD